MYLAALHVVHPQTNAEGINAFHYAHGQQDWVIPPNPDEQPGTLVNSQVSVAPGSNRVRSYLDIVAPDGATWSEIRQELLRFILDNEEAPMPWSDRIGRCLFRLGMESALARDWTHEARVLYEAAKAVRAIPA
jgi:hypothetical protein